MNKLQKYKTEKLDKKSIQLRLNILTAVERFKRGHIGGAFSSIEIIRVIYDYFMKLKNKDYNPSSSNQFILSKGHGCLSLYSVLYDKKIISLRTLKSFTGLDSILGGHPEHIIPSVNVSTGSLGHGFSIAAGISLANKIKKNKSLYTFVLLGDGELNEGSIWECCLSIKKNNLTNLITLVDYNKMQSYGTTKEVMHLEPLGAKWKAFGFNVMEINGHNLNQIKKTISNAKKNKKNPTVIICHTVKGKGLSVAENNATWHYKSNFTEEEIFKVSKELKSKK